MIKFYAPASIGNIGVGFDILGAAIIPIDGTLLGDIVSIKKSKNLEINHIGKFSKQLPKNILENITWKAIKLFETITNKKSFIKVKLEKNMPIGSGLGSSASSVVSIILALDHFYDTKLNPRQLLKLMGKLEGSISGSVHYDNVAPCYLGGIQLITEDKLRFTQSLPIFKKWIWVIAWPGTKLTTSNARKILPKNYTQQICIKNSRNLSTFIHALYTKQPNLAIRVMNDVIAEPYRIPLIPNFLKIKKTIIKLGALTCNISGSGPTIFSICNNINIAKRIKNWFLKNYREKEKGFVHICTIDRCGARKIGTTENEII
ncbi:homoserine kinase [Buchnera aphidicola (Cinara tujafilina)]|uniref:Homoserine kinase n=1 Tax=Buchnera aphidicola (Cinara tujafilina) TaxID=261317 RepID=F7WZ65_9GAMM|nr:homoserine kinase [Buchnera aphidicola]AEH39719.1 homoserine kinase [Buchnera aphidicola (Cinara tujafilina)]